MTHSPADVLLAHLVASGLVVRPDKKGAWIGYVSYLPAGMPDQALAVLDTSGRLDGRLQGAETVEHPGIQIIVRAKDHVTGYQKASTVSTFLDTIINVAVSRDNSNYQVKSITKTSGVFSVGQEPETNRHLFTLNALVTIREL